jgi:polysaccharide pyruvyl transferase WcaK-like protein
MGVDAILSTDVAFALGRQSCRRERDVLVNVSGLLWRPNPHVDYQQYRRVVVEFSRMHLSAGRAVGLLAHVLDSSWADNDVPAVHAAAVEIGGNVEVIIPTDLDDARRTIAGSGLLHGARMHACINALTVGIPCVPWAYSRKFEPLFSSLGWSYGIDLRRSSEDMIGAIVCQEQRLQGAWEGQVRTVERVAQRRLDSAVGVLRQLGGGDG